MTTLHAPVSIDPKPLRWTAEEYDRAVELGLFDLRRPELLDGVIYEQAEPMLWSGEEFDRAADLGLFGQKQVELIDGQIWEKGPMNDPHAMTVRLANYAMLRIFGVDAFTVSVQCPMRLGIARPQPDIAVVAGRPRDIAKHPTGALLIIEVSDSSLELDRVKASVYARNGIADYWIISINERCVEVRRRPSGNDDQASYAEVRRFVSGQSISPLALPDQSIAVDDLLP